MNSAEEPLRRWRDADGTHIDVRGLPWAIATSTRRRA